MRRYRRAKARSLDDLACAEAPEPRPGPGQVLVRMRAWSLNYRDLMVASGAYGASGTKPDLVPLSDGAGEVAELGADVTGVKVGDRICPTFFQGWIAGDIVSDDPVVVGFIGHHAHAFDRWAPVVFTAIVMVVTALVLRRKRRSPAGA